MHTKKFILQSTYKKVPTKRSAMFLNIDNSTALKNVNALETDVLDSNQKKLI